VFPIVLANLQRAGASVPDVFAARWREFGAATTRDNLALMSQLAHLFELFDAHGIQAATWKGPVFASTVYGSLSLRNSGDLDLLVAADRISDVCALLTSHGYRMAALSGWLEPAARREYQFEPREAGRSAVEAQAFVALWPLGIHLPTQELIARGTTVTVAGCPVRTLSHEDTLLSIALHGAGHGWSHLRLVADVDACVRAPIDWHVVVERARAARMRRILSIALLLAHDLLDAPVAPSVVDHARSDRTAVWLATFLARKLGGLAKPRYRDWVGCLSGEGPIDQMGYALRQLFMRQVVTRGDRAAASRALRQDRPS
jgi:hypothetical protein